ADLGPRDGRARVVNFWATWCPPCLAEIPLLTAWADAHPDVDVVFVSIDHPSVRTRGDAVLRERGLEGRRVLHLGAVDPSATLAAAVPGWSDSVPFTIVVSGSGERLATYSRGITGADLDAAFEGTAP